MPEELVKQAKKRAVGTKQTLKAVDRGTARIVVVARDADERVIRDLLQNCDARGVEVVYLDSMQVLGRACGIEVGAAAVAILND